MWFGQDPEIKPLAEEELETVQRMIPEIPLWIKNPDFDRVSIGFGYNLFHFKNFISLDFVFVFLKVDWLNKLIEYMWPYLDKVSIYFQLINVNFI